jgi:nucleotide-binding universal stress UspA family protein
MAATTQPQIIVVGVDYSETSELALSHALEIASTGTRAEVHVVHVTSTFHPLVGVEHTPETMPPVPKIDETLRELGNHVDRRLELFMNRREPSSPLPERVVLYVRYDSPAQEIALLARDLDAHLVIVGTHGRRGISRVLLGSVAEGVVRLSPCPVLVVRPREVSVAPSIEPPCEHCVKTRIATGGQRTWCNHHNLRHGSRHTYHQRDRIASDGSMPLLFH